MIFLDTNILIRFLTRDDPDKADACFELLQKAEAQEITLVTTEAVIAEVVYVLSSPKLYNLSREDIRNRLYPVLSIKGLKIPYRKMYLRALDLYVTYPLDFEDVVILAQMERQHINEVYSYDKGFDDVEGIQRLEP
ncbi:MAG: PIN domain-containing protein [Chloroflexota bacterium]|nr:PIN domain-containing protein [Chloroflexota bacterium]